MANGRPSEFTGWAGIISEIYIGSEVCKQHRPVIISVPDFSVVTGLMLRSHSFKQQFESLKINYPISVVDAPKYQLGVF